jgi:hypothetical protein
MNIEGTYKVNIEQTVRKLGESEDETIERMLSWVGLRPSDIPPDPQREAKIQKLIAAQEQDELATTMRLEITADRVSIRSTDGDGDYPIKSWKETGDGRINVVVEFSDDEDEESGLKCRTVIERRTAVLVPRNFDVPLTVVVGPQPPELEIDQLHGRAYQRDIRYPYPL